MMEQKVAIITSNKTLAGSASGAYLSAGIHAAVFYSVPSFLTQDRQNIAIALVDVDVFGGDRLGGLRNLLGGLKGMPLIALCDPARTSHGEMVGLLSSGVDDVIHTSVDMSLLVAKTRAHLRRSGFGMRRNDQAARNWCQGDS